MPAKSQTLEDNMLAVSGGKTATSRDFDLFRVSVPCQHACPAMTDIPGYLAAVAAGDYDQAYRINFRDNVFPGVLGRVCTRPCEPVCRHGREGLGETVAICAAKRAAADFRKDRQPVVLPQEFADSGKRVAVVGAGPAGLTVARELSRWGHRVEVFEQDEQAGGLMAQGIPRFRLPRAVVAEEVAQVLAAGIQLHVGVIGDVGALRSQFDAVVWATGAQKLVWPDLPGLELAGVEHGLPFLRRVNRGQPPQVGRRVVVIGGGFTAVDCGRIARRLGAENIQIFYRRSGKEMYISDDEVAALRAEGVGFTAQVMPVGFRGTGRVQRAVLARTRPGELDESGRHIFERIAGTEFEVEADMVLLGFGQQPDWPAVAEEEGAPVFFAGDVAMGSTSLIDAIGHAKRCAWQVDEALMGPRLGDEIEVGPVVRGTGRTREMDFIPRQVMEICGLNSANPHREVEAGLTRAQAVAEASRCYQCQVLFEIDNKRCIYCDMCILACPVPECIVKVAGVERDSAGRWLGFAPSTGPKDYHALCIDPDACIRCDLCVKACPVDCIPAKGLEMHRAAAGASGSYEKSVLATAKEKSDG